jgi:F0F1-type ATP synthase delta subunit
MFKSDRLIYLFVYKKKITGKKKKKIIENICKNNQVHIAYVIIDNRRINYRQMIVPLPREMVSLHFF